MIFIKIFKFKRHFFAQKAKQNAQNSAQLFHPKKAKQNA